MAYTNKPKPDDRSDNVEKLQHMIHDTIENMEEAEESLELTDSEEQRQQIEAKNQRRRESLDAMRSEVQDEAKATNETNQKY
ncbi:MAG TPA: small acid-soluble spore protein Tlp [Bacillales bacterium]|nr:small acid-soluble spore protein Tlp [Bacillales bacterium]